MTNLTTLLTRLRALLMDAGSVVWDDDTLREGLRLALGEYGLAAAQDTPGAPPVTLEGLDGATVTSLEPLHESLIVWGAAGCCALARAVDRAESYLPGSDPSALKGWGEQRLKEFKAMLGAAFPGYLPALAGGAGAEQADPALTAAQIAHLQAQSAALQAQAAATTGQEERAAAAAAQSAQDRLDEAARRAGLRQSAEPAWGCWPDRRDPRYPADYERS